ncbi:MAG TPA: 4Fe-4S dicluster domain-containing protein [Rectinemataceae bacterium]|nr:4Fe-4S dicluster domain-containing protein [Rectinemataceae bacterium]
MGTILHKYDVKALLIEAAGDWDVYAPFEEAPGDVAFRRMNETDRGGGLARLELGDLPSLAGPKGLFFPQSETLFRFGSGGVEETVESSPKLLFGIRSCDLAGLLFADGFFEKDFADSYRHSRRQGSLLVVKGCLSPPRPTSCFCVSAGTGPFAEGGFDLQLVELGEDYAVEIGSEAGERFVADHPRYFAPRDSPSAEIARVKEGAAETLGLKVDFGKALKLMEAGDFEKVYAELGERCIYCGACLYVCPTCTCFNVFDRGAGGEGERLRNWDGCVFEGYTREASGHNPRTKKSSRTARRYEHKLKYDPSAAGRSGCVGCGRCLDACPVGIGMSKFIRTITGGTEES